MKREPSRPGAVQSCVKPKDAQAQRDANVPLAKKIARNAVNTVCVRVGVCGCQKEKKTCFLLHALFLALHQSEVEARTVAHSIVVDGLFLTAVVSHLNSAYIVHLKVSEK